MSAFGALIGAQLQRVDAPHPDLVALTLHTPALHGVLLLSCAPDALGWGFVAERPRGEPASSFVQLLRKHGSNARLTAVDPARGRVLFARGDETFALALSADPPNLVLERLSPDGTREGLGGRRGLRLGPPPRGLAADGETLADRGEALARAVMGGALDADRRALAKLVRRREAALRRRLRKIEADLERVDDVDGLRARGSALLAALSTLPRDARTATVMDWSAEPPAEIEIPIDPRRTPREEADHLFTRARKLERGGEIALRRHAATEAELDALREIGAQIDAADEASLEALSQRARQLGARAQRVSAGRRGEPEARAAYRTFHAASGRSVLVGRSATDNDTLTLRHARPWDLWLHARGVPGSHVVVPLEKGESCPPDLLADAAHLAAHFSELRGEDRVEVSYLERRYVRKPRGAAPGSVTLQRERVFLLRLEPDRLARVLEAEQH